MRIAKAVADGVMPTLRRDAWLTAGIVFNLGLLGYFKYANFFVDNLNAALGCRLARSARSSCRSASRSSPSRRSPSWSTPGRARSAKRGFVHYGLFVTYFPHLIAGPVLHHAQMMPQFADPSVYRFDGANFCAGLAIFAIGLFKKVVLADGIAPYADAVFGRPTPGRAAGIDEAWLGALAYTLQLYFDFSGYSDMAIGLSWMFGIRLPFNFDSPYKATNISDFWRRWHISLSDLPARLPLHRRWAATARAPSRRYVNLVPDHGAGRPVARRELVLRALGRPARRLPDGRTMPFAAGRVAAVRGASTAAGSTRRCAWALTFALRRDRGLGLLSRRDTARRAAHAALAWRACGPAVLDAGVPAAGTPA